MRSDVKKLAKCNNKSYYYCKFICWSREHGCKYLEKAGVQGK